MNWAPNQNGYPGYGQEPWGQRYTPPMGQPVQQLAAGMGQPAVQPMGLFDVIGQGTRVDWVQGEAAMKSYMVRPGMSVILFDMENPKRVYVKAVNMAGVPIFTAGYDLGDIELGKPAAAVDDSRYVSREEFERSMNHIAQLFANITEHGAERKDDAERSETARMGYESERTAESAEHSESGTGFPGI